MSSPGKSCATQSWIIHERRYHLAEKIPNEGGLASAVLPDQHDQRLGAKVGVIEGGGGERVVLVLLLKREEHLLVEDLHLVDHALVVPLAPAPVLAAPPHPLGDPPGEGGELGDGQEEAES